MSTMTDRINAILQDPNGTLTPEVAQTLVEARDSLERRGAQIRRLLDCTEGDLAEIRRARAGRDEARKTLDEALLDKAQLEDEFHAMRRERDEARAQRDAALAEVDEALAGWKADREFWCSEARRLWQRRMG